MAFLDAHHSITPLLHWLGLSNRRLRFWFFHDRCADWFALFHKFDLAVRGESRSRWDQVTHNQDRKSTRLNSSHTVISYAVFCLKKKKKKKQINEMYGRHMRT